jgi:hypothetical protein
MYEVRFEVLTVALLKMQILWGVTLCRWIGNTRRRCNILEELNFYACVSFATCARTFIRIHKKIENHQTDFHGIFTRTEIECFCRNLLTLSTFG